MLFDAQAFLQNNAVFLFVALWVLPWKGWALWKAARLRDKWWFVAIFILNTLAILDILYIYWISKRKKLAAAMAVEPVAAEVSLPATVSPPEEKPKKSRARRRATPR